MIDRITKDDLIKIHQFMDKYKTIDGDADELKEFYLLVKKLHATYNFLLMRCQELIRQKGNVDVLNVELADLKIEYNELKTKYDKNRSIKSLEKERERSATYYASLKMARKTIDELKKQLDIAKDEQKK